jgi:hypothetical protein
VNAVARAGIDRDDIAEEVPMAATPTPSLTMPIAFSNAVALLE